ncbi:MAG TPA: hypothetical protein VEA41_05795 [Salinarimonas sp.]|nr:hypothetical protein [Salinarimonas sp.]
MAATVRQPVDDPALVQFILEMQGCRMVGCGDRGGPFDFRLAGETWLVDCHACGVTYLWD